LVKLIFSSSFEVGVVSFEFFPGVEKIGLASTSILDGKIRARFYLDWVNSSLIAKLNEASFGDLQFGHLWVGYGLAMGLVHVQAFSMGKFGLTYKCLK